MSWVHSWSIFLFSSNPSKSEFSGRDLSLCFLSLLFLNSLPSWGVFLSNPWRFWEVILIVLISKCCLMLTLVKLFQLTWTFFWRPNWCFSRASRLRRFFLLMVCLIKSWLIKALTWRDPRRVWNLAWMEIKSDVLTFRLLTMKRSYGCMESGVNGNQKSIAWCSWRSNLCPQPW